MFSILTAATLAISAATADAHVLTPDAFLTEWLMVGPFPNGASVNRQEAFQNAHGTDYLGAQSGGRELAPSEGDTQDWQGQTYTWRAVASPTYVLDLTHLYEPLDDVTIYAWAQIEADAETGAVLAVGSDDGVQVWLNGELVHDFWAPRGVTVDGDIIAVRLRAGRNSLLLKVGNGDGGWGFVARFLGPGSATAALSHANDIDAFRALMAIGADVNATDNDGRTRLHRACLLGETDIVVALIELGASVAGVGPRGLTPLHEAASGGHPDVVSALLSHGAAVDALALADVTPLHLSRRAGYDDAAQLLIDGGADESRVPGSQREQVDAVFSYGVGEDTPGAAVLVSQGDAVLLEAAYGMANLEHGVPVATDTIFRIGSMTKQFTAAAILLLEQDGLLRVEDPLSKFLPEYPRGDEITLRHLLSHTSGIVNGTVLPDFWAGIRLAVTHEEYTASFRDLPLDFEPGAGWKYSNSGYYLLGMVIEDVSAMGYEEFMQSRVFSPLLLDDTGYDRSERLLKRRAAGYDRAGSGYQNAPFIDMSQPFSGGALYSTVGDLHAWNRAIMHGELVSREAMARAATRVALTDGSERDYGFGWRLADVRGLRMVWHSGGIPGFNASIAYYPSLDATVVVLANSRSNVDSTRAAREIAEIYFHGEMDPQTE